MLWKTAEHNTRGLEKLLNEIDWSSLLKDEKINADAVDGLFPSDMTDSCQLKLVTCVIKTSLHEHCVKTVIEFLLVCTVYPELSCVLLQYVSFTNKE